MKHTERLNWDHVFPVSWYPDSHDAQEEKWKVPSCPQCNSKLGAIEKDLLIRLGLALNPDHPAAAGIGEKAIRSLDANAAKTGKDRKQRQRKLEQIQAETTNFDSATSESTYPGFGPDRFPEHTNLLKIGINEKHIADLTKKIVRGMLYLDEGKLVDERFQINVYPMREHDAARMLQIVRGWNERAHEPGIKVLRATVPEDRVTSVFRIEIWGQLFLHAIVDAKESPDGTPNEPYSDI
ncbi:MAG: hypothetical protein KDI33_16025 [Halioglobus sp.]|nr:hypothetical protein [Halioglobus sp.]